MEAAPCARTDEYRHARRSNESLGDFRYLAISVTGRVFANRFG